MTNNKGILIQNIYYMLSYAFQELRKNNYENISKEDFEHIQDLFAEILYKGIAFQLKQGLYREYIERCDTLSVLRGKLDINETIRNRFHHKQVLSCEYDELSENNTFNQILKTTSEILIRDKVVSVKRKKQLKSLMPFFEDVASIDPFTIHWNMLRYQRGNQTYKMLMNICYFVLDGMLLTTESGPYKMINFSEEHMSRLFEKFVLEYYRYHHKELSAHPCHIHWDITNPDEAVIDLLPQMKTDVTLKKGGRTLIIDTKYYRRAIQQLFDKQTIHSGNMYQIYSYVKNYDKDNSGLVSGMLLYARTQEEISPNMDAFFGSNHIWVRTLDLNQDFKIISEQLNNIITVAFG